MTFMIGFGTRHDEGVRSCSMMRRSAALPLGFETVTPLPDSWQPHRLSARTREYAVRRSRLAMRRLNRNVSLIQSGKADRGDTVLKVRSHVGIEPRACALR
jgi:hypothetical protein